MSLKDKMKKLGDCSSEQTKLNETLTGATQKLDDVVRKLRERYEEQRRKSQPPMPAVSGVK